MRLFLFIVLSISYLFSCSNDGKSATDTFLDIKDILKIRDERVNDFEDISEPVETNDIEDVYKVEDSEDVAIFDIVEIADIGPVNILNISLIIHLENPDILNSKNLFDSYVLRIDEYATLFEKYGAKLSFEAKEIVPASVKYGSDVLNRLQSRGHSVNLHADSGTSPSMNFSDFVQELRDKKEKMENISIDPLAVSGICSQLDWVAASFNVGFKYITSLTAFCLKSLPLETQPDFVKSCLVPSDCQQAYPFEFEKSLYPWRAKLGRDWRIDDSEGLMVLLPNSSRLVCLDEEYKNPNKNVFSCTFDNFDIERSLDIIDNALKIFNKDKIGLVAFVMSFGKDFPDKPLLEEWLSEVDVYVKKQKLKWRNTDEIFNEYESKR